MSFTFFVLVLVMFALTEASTFKHNMIFDEIKKIDHSPLGFKLFVPILTSIGLLNMNKNIDLSSLFSRHFPIPKHFATKCLGNAFGSNRLSAFPAALNNIISDDTDDYIGGEYRIFECPSSSLDVTGGWRIIHGDGN